MSANPLIRFDEVYRETEPIAVVKLLNTIERLDLCDRDLAWIHPDYEQEFQRSLKSQQNLVA